MGVVDDVVRGSDGGLQVLLAMVTENSFFEFLLFDGVHSRSLSTTEERMLENVVELRPHCFDDVVVLTG